MTSYRLMEKKRLGKKSKEQWKALWTRALEIGICPYDDRCNIKTATCEHLDSYLEWGTTRAFFEPLVRLDFRESVDEFEVLHEILANTQGVWSLFKKLRRAGVGSRPAVLLIRKYSLKQGQRLIMRELGIKSNSMFQQRMREAVMELRSAFGKT